MYLTKCRLRTSVPKKDQPKQRRRDKSEMEENLYCKLICIWNMFRHCLELDKFYICCITLVCINIDVNKLILK